MALSSFTCEFIIRENQYKPIKGKVITIGRQTINLTPHKALELFNKCGIDVSGVDPDNLPLDTETMAGLRQKTCIRDDVFFKLLGVDDLHYLDHTNYEGADLIHNMNEPLPDELCNIADFIIDGSTLDNVFNPAMALINMSKMLKPGRRLFAVNISCINNASRAYDPYIAFSPIWFFDYFVVNKYLDCVINVLVHDHKNPGQYSIYALNAEKITEENNQRSIVASDYIMSTILIAEKGMESTFDAIPNQWPYETKKEQSEYLSNLRTMKFNCRPDYLFSNKNLEINIPNMYRLVASEDIIRLGNLTAPEISYGKIHSIISWLKHCMSYKT